MVQAVAPIAKVAATAVATALPAGAEFMPAIVSATAAAPPVAEAAGAAAAIPATTEMMGGQQKPLKPEQKQLKRQRPKQ